jgi:SPP1 family predicted phage head-tail adaptor
MDYQVNAGEMRTWITLQSPTLTTDAGGAQVPGWANVSPNPSVWARCVMAHGQEVVNSEALKSAQRMVITIRNRSDIQTSWRVKLPDDTYWQIISVDPIQGRNRYLELVAEHVKGSV